MFYVWFFLDPENGENEGEHTYTQKRSGESVTGPGQCIMYTYRGAFWRDVWSDRKIKTRNMFLVMRQNDFVHDQDRDFCI